MSISRVHHLIRQQAASSARIRAQTEMTPHEVNAAINHLQASDKIVRAGKNRRGHTIWAAAEGSAQPAADDDGAEAIEQARKINVVADPSVEGRERVHRDPCFLCGVRGDLGCRHRRWA